jgi:hypothetical protein
MFDANCFDAASRAPFSLNPNTPASPIVLFVAEMSPRPIWSHPRAMTSGIQCASVSLNSPALMRTSSQTNDWESAVPQKPGIDDNLDNVFQGGSPHRQLLEDTRSEFWFEADISDVGAEESPSLDDQNSHHSIAEDGGICFEDSFLSMSNHINRLKQHFEDKDER